MVNEERGLGENESYLMIIMNLIFRYHIDMSGITLKRHIDTIYLTSVSEHKTELGLRAMTERQTLPRKIGGCNYAL